MMTTISTSGGIGSSSPMVRVLAPRSVNNGARRDRPSSPTLLTEAVFKGRPSTNATLRAGSGRGESCACDRLPMPKAHSVAIMAIKASRKYRTDDPIL